MPATRQADGWSSTQDRRLRQVAILAYSTVAVPRARCACGGHGLYPASVATEEMEGAARVEVLRPEPSAVPEARRLAADVAARRMSAEQCHNLELAVTEVVANAVRHSCSDDDVKLSMTPKDGYLCVRVTDGGAGLVPRPGAMGSEDGAGFGLFIVEQLTRRWGMTREGGKTRVWFELDYVAST